MSGWVVVDKRKIAGVACVRGATRWRTHAVASDVFATREAAERFRSAWRNPENWVVCRTRPKDGCRWILVDPRTSREETRQGIDWRYFGQEGWRFSIVDACPFPSRAAAEAALPTARSWADEVVVRRVRPRGVDRGTDAECAAATQRALDRVEKAERELERLRAEVAALVERWRTP